MERVDTWASQQEDVPGRSEAIRRLLELGLHVGQPRRIGPHKGAAKAKAIAEEKIESMIDPAAPDEERQKRKRRLLKGPSEFHEIRADLPKTKLSR